MSESEMQLQQELANSRLLHEISKELIGEQNIDVLYGKNRRRCRAPHALTVRQHADVAYGE